MLRPICSYILKFRVDWSLMKGSLIFAENFNDMAVDLVNDADFIQKLQDNDKVVVKYYADWCGSCRLFSPKYKRLSNDERYQGITFLDVNAEKNPEARRMAGVSSLPYFAVFRKGELVEGLCSSKEEVVTELIQKL